MVNVFHWIIGGCKKCNETSEYISTALYNAVMESNAIKKLSFNKKWRYLLISELNHKYKQIVENDEQKK